MFARVNFENHRFHEQQQQCRYGNLATVNDPYWFGRVKVVMDDGGLEKSYLFSKGEIEVLTTDESG